MGLFKGLNMLQETKKVLDKNSLFYIVNPKKQIIMSQVLCSIQIYMYTSFLFCSYMYTNSCYCNEQSKCIFVQNVASVVD